VSENADLPNVVRQYLDHPDLGKLNSAGSAHKPRVLLLYGSLRERSYSRFLAQEAQRILHEFGAETRMFNPSGLPLPDDAGGEPPEGAGAARAVPVVGGACLGESRASRQHDRHHEDAD